MDHDAAVTILLRGVPLIREHYAANSCIGSTRIGLDLLAALGVDAKPVVVQAGVGTAEWWDAIQRGVTGRAILDVPGAWSVGLGVPNPGKDWAMHLVIVTCSALVDLTLDQASRPERGMALAPAAMPLPPDMHRRLMEGRRPVVFRDDGNGAVIAYQARVGNRDYTTSPNWGRRDAALRHRIVGQILRSAQLKVPG